MANLGNIGTAIPCIEYEAILTGGVSIGGTGPVQASLEILSTYMGDTGYEPTSAINLNTVDVLPLFGTVVASRVDYDTSGVISGTVRRNGVNQAGVYVALLEEQSGTNLGTQISDANGNFSFPNLYKNQPIYTIVAWGDDYTLGLTQSNLTPTTNFILDYLDSGGSTRVQTKVLTDVAGRVRETTISSYLSYTTTVGDGSSTSFVLTHNLDSRDLIIQVRRASAPYDLVDVAIEYTSVNSVTLTFAAPPAVNDFRVIILG